jgi:putative peptidoglycan lipid II flippase
MIKTLLKNGASLFFAKQTTILSAASVIMLIGLLSRLLGLVRDRVLASFFTPPNLDIYFAATRIPNLVFDLVVAGTLSAAFIPVFSEYLGQKKEEEGFAVASVMITLSLLVFLGLTAAYFVFAQPLSKIIAPGFETSRVSLMADLTRVMLVAQVFLILANYLTGIAHSYQRFVIPAISLALYNVGIIWGTALFSPTFGLYGPALGMVAGSFLYLMVQLPLLHRLGFKFSLSFDYRLPGVGKIVKLTAPRLLGLVANQADATADVMLASLASAGALTYFSFAQHLQFFPVGLLGLAMAQAALPVLSLSAGRQNLDEFKNLFITTLHQMLFLIIPVSVAILVLRIPLVRLIFGAARFDWEATVMTGYVVAAFAISIFAQSVAYYLARGFYALQDTMTPVKIQILSTILGIALSVTFILKMGLPVWSIALAYSLATYLHALLLLLLLHQRVGGFDFGRLLTPFVKISLSSLASGGVMYIFLKILDRSAWDQRLSFLGRLSLPAHFEVFVIDTRYTVNLIILTTIVGTIGAIVYLLMVKLLRVEEVEIFVKLLRKLKPPLLK